MSTSPLCSPPPTQNPTLTEEVAVTTADSKSQQSEKSDEAWFSPALWQQRRILARQLIDRENATSVIDFGCGEGALVSFLIWESQGDYPIRRLVGVDLDPSELARANEDCQPQDFELGDKLRVHSLEIEFFQGSVARADKRLLGFDALACMEVVEHLDPEVLSEFWNVVLGTLKPKLLIVSTPNAEFNIHFTQLNYGTDHAILRNTDHRFEWTRQEFEAWCKKAADQYGYSVSFTGVGNLPHQDPAVGFCTQVAVLKDLHPSNPPIHSAQEDVYTPFAKIDYPTYDKVHSEEDNLEYLLERIARTRPQPPPPQKEQDQLNEERASDGLDPWICPAVEMGVLTLDDLWLETAVRQRCKTKGNMICILGKSPLLHVDVSHGRVTFYEQDAFWAESDKKYDALFTVSMAPESLSDDDEDKDENRDAFFEEGYVNENDEYQFAVHDEQEQEPESPWDESTSWSWNKEEKAECLFYPVMD
ncbi:Small RNA 2'-O-methyltransferase [Gryganskiella cystojenkinii]|nr:Small RNA 2'-O-methyltransferase [Gryganskiella cystojenkinii]